MFPGKWKDCYNAVFEDGIDISSAAFAIDTEFFEAWVNDAKQEQTIQEHGYAKNMLSAIKAEEPDMIIHLGDGEGDLVPVRMKYPDLPIENVRGNCDRHSTALMVLKATIVGKRFFAAHGHMFDVKLDPSFTRLRYSAMEDDADIVLFGHTHTPYKDRSLAMEILNPGTCGEVAAPTYGVIRIAENETETEIKEVR